MNLEFFSTFSSLSFNPSISKGQRDNGIGRFIYRQHIQIYIYSHMNLKDFLLFMPSKNWFISMNLRGLWSEWTFRLHLNFNKAGRRNVQRNFNSKLLNLSLWLGGIATASSADHMFPKSMKHPKRNVGVCYNYIPTLDFLFVIRLAMAEGRLFIFETPRLTDLGLSRLD